MYIGTLNQLPLADPVNPGHVCTATVDTSVKCHCIPQTVSTSGSQPISGNNYTAVNINCSRYVHKHIIDILKIVYAYVCMYIIHIRTYLCTYVRT